MKGGNKGGDVLLSGAAVIFDLVDGAIQGVDGLPRLLLPLGNGDGVTGNLVLERAGHFFQWADLVVSMISNSTLGTDGIGAGLAVSVDLHANVFLAAGNPLHGGISGQGFLKGDLLMSGCGFAFFVRNEAGRSNVFVAVNAVHGGIFLLAEVTLDHPVDVPLIGLGKLDQGVDEGVAGKECNSAQTGEDEGSTALVATEVRRLGHGSELLGLETAKAEGVQAGKGAGVIEGLVAHWALDQPVDCVERGKVQQKKKEKDEEDVSELVEAVESKGEFTRDGRE